ncbi:MAG: hypothetical protein WDM79_18950 [Terricaulis sp.]
MWLGPAPVDWGYHPDYAHFNWRGWRRSVRGSLGDMGAHLIDFPIWALEPGLPTRIETRHTLWGGDTNPWDGRGPAELTSYPLASTTHYSFANAPGGPLALTWYDAGLMPADARGPAARAHHECRRRRALCRRCRHADARNLWQQPDAHRRRRRSARRPPSRKRSRASKAAKAATR